MTRQAGAALITALMITAIATVAAVAMATRQQLDIRRTGNIMDADQAYLFALGVEDWAREILARDRREGSVDNLGEDWATVLPPLSFEGGVVAGRIEDMQGRFNINNLLKDGAPSELDKTRFRRLLKALDLDEDLVQAVIDWMDKDEEPGFPAGAEDEEYLKRSPPYRASNAPLTSPSELLLIKGVTSEAFERLAPYVSALPGRTAININTAQAPVVRMLVEGMTGSEAEQLIEDRGDEGFKATGDFMSHPLVKERTPPPEGIAVSSDHFMIQAMAQYGRGRIQLYSLVSRAGQGHNVRVVMRGQGAY